MQLRSYYEAPGLLLLAVGDAGEPVGCVGLRVIGTDTGEVRRLFVTPQTRTTGVGRALMVDVIGQARSLGLARLVLNTLPTMTHAAGLYRSLGFVPSAPYIEEPTDGVLFFDRPLT